MPALRPLLLVCAALIAGCAATGPQQPAAPATRGIADDAGAVDREIVPTTGVSFSAAPQAAFAELQAAPIGHLEAATLAGAKLAADLTLTGPQGRQAVAGAITALSWGGQPTDALEVTARVSAANREKLLAAKAEPATAAIAFTCWRHSTADGTFYAAVAPAAAPLAGPLAPGWGVEAPPDATTPQTYVLKFKLRPSTDSQWLRLGTPSHASSTAAFGPAS